MTHNKHHFYQSKGVNARKNIKPDGLDVEFSMELADHDDLEALARSKAADERANSQK